MVLLQQSSLVVGHLGALVIMVGIAVGLARFFRLEIAALRGRPTSEMRRILRQDLGHHLLLGMEFLVAADVIDTLMRPGLEELAGLAAVVAIRTVIGWSLNAELRESRPDPAS